MPRTTAEATLDLTICCSEVGEGITEEVALELSLEGWVEIWQTDEGIYSSGSLRGREGSTWGKVAQELSYSYKRELCFFDVLTI